MNIDIRDMTPADWPRISDIYRQGIDSGNATFETDCPDYESWDSSHLQYGRFVALFCGEIAGFLALAASSKRSAYSGVAEVSIYVDSKFRRQGVGRALLDTLCGVSEKLGIWTLQTSIIEDNTPSIRLHESVGFRIVGIREKISRNKFGEWKSTVFMERRSKTLF